MMKRYEVYSGTINLKAIFAGAIISIGVFHLFATGIRGVGGLVTTGVTYNQRISFMLVRTLVMSFAFFLAAFISVYTSKSKDIFSGLLHGLASVSFIHLMVTIIFPRVAPPDQTIVQANLYYPLFFFRNFFTLFVAWIAGLYGCWFAVKVDIGEIVLRFKNKKTPLDLW